MAEMKLSVADVLELRRMYDSLKEGGWNTATFFRVQGRRLGVSPKTIYEACTRRTYKKIGRIKL